MEKASAPVSDNSDGGKFYKMRRGSLTTFSVLHHCPIKQVLCDEGKFSIFALNGDTVDFECFVKSVSSYRLICVKGSALFNWISQRVSEVTQNPVLGMGTLFRPITSAHWLKGLRVESNEELFMCSLIGQRSEFIHLTAVECSTRTCFYGKGNSRREQWPTWKERPFDSCEKAHFNGTKHGSFVLFCWWLSPILAAIVYVLRVSDNMSGQSGDPTESAGWHLSFADATVVSTG